MRYLALIVFNHPLPRGGIATMPSMIAADNDEMVRLIKPGLTMRYLAFLLLGGQ